MAKVVNIAKVTKLAKKPYNALFWLFLSVLIIPIIPKIIPRILKINGNPAVIKVIKASSPKRAEYFDVFVIG